MIFPKKVSKHEVSKEKSKKGFYMIEIPQFRFLQTCGIKNKRFSLFFSETNHFSKIGPFHFCTLMAPYLSVKI